LQERVQLVVSSLLQRNQNAVHERGIRTTGKSVLLGATHLGRRDHLHGLGDLRRVADRSNSPPYVLRIRHCLEN
jgi:hypothetical protein